ASTGLAPHQWLLAERVERAKELLETTRLTAQAIATRVGLGSAESLRHHFRRRVGTTPGQYRRRFSQRTCRRLATTRAASDSRVLLSRRSTVPRRWDSRIP